MSQCGPGVFRVGKIQNTGGTMDDGARVGKIKDAGGTMGSGTSVTSGEAHVHHISRSSGSFHNIRKPHAQI
jgi:hypothetical protein